MRKIIFHLALSKTKRYRQLEIQSMLGDQKRRLSNRQPVFYYLVSDRIAIEADRD